MSLYETLEDIEKYCMDNNWAGFDEEAIEKSTIDTAKFLETLGFTFLSLESGHIEATIQINSKKELKVIIGPQKHTIAFFSGNVSFEKEIFNKDIMSSREAILGFIDFYRYFF